jgi:hypothetical protein
MCKKYRGGWGPPSQHEILTRGAQPPWAPLHYTAAIFNNVLTKLWVSKRLGELKNKTTQRLGNKNLSSFPKPRQSMTKKQCQQSYMSIQYVNQSESLSWSFSDLSGDKWCLQRKYMCRQQESLDTNSCHRSGKGHVWQLNCVTSF